MAQDDGMSGAASMAAELRRARPDLLVAALPAERGRDDLPVMDLEEATAVGRESAVTADEIVAGIELAPSKRSERWQRVEGDVFAHLVTMQFDLDDAEAAFDGFLRVRWVLEQAGWALRPMDSPTPWFVSESPSGLSAEVATQESFLELTVASRTVRLLEAPS